MDGVIALQIPYFYIAHILIVLVRVGATLLFAPIWGHPALPAYFRLLLVFALAVGVAAVVPFNAQAYANIGLAFPAEFLIGLLLSMGLRIAFAGLHLGGHLIGFYLGFSAIEAIDPQTMNRSTVMSGFFTLLGYVILLASNLHHSIFRILAASYATFPIGIMPAPAQWFDSLIALSGQMFVIGWRIAFPIFVVSFLVELTIGFISRMQPQINTLIVAAPLKLLMGMVVLGSSIVFLPGVLSSVVDAIVLGR